MSRLITLDIDPMEIPSIALTYEHRQSIIRELARRHVENGRYHGETLKEAADQAASDMKGIDTPYEIKKSFRHEVRRLERLGRGGW